MFAPQPPSASSASSVTTLPEAWTTLRLFDCLVPFFVDHTSDDPGKAINWSKIPFADLERDGVLDPEKVAAILPAFNQYIGTMAELGYNAVAIDDLAHLVNHDFYPATLQRKLASYRDLYDQVFAIIAAHGLRLFVITDYQFFNSSIEGRLAATNASPVDFFVETLTCAFATYPTIDGLLLRIGEGDGVDVEGDFKSRLTIRQTAEARALLDRVLPVFEAYDKTLVFRTWTLGAYQIGDLMWNQQTYDAVFGEIASPHLIVSLKYGDTDFFRYLALNPLFFHGPQQKIIEFQCRREYEGMGEYPSFVGWLYADYLRQLRAKPSNLVGIYAIQAGGWAPFQKLAFCGGREQRSLWNELNTFVTAHLVTTDASVETIVADFCQQYGIADAERFLRLLKLSDEVINDGLYIRQFASDAVYFRRVRIPPLTWVFWNNVTTSGLISLLHRYLVHDKTAAIADGQRAIGQIEEMIEIAEDLGLGDVGLAFQRQTFAILACLREVLLGVDTPRTATQLATLLEDYRQHYPAGYRFDDAQRDATVPGRSITMLFQLLVRRHARYRRGDRVLLNPYVSRLKAYLVQRQAAKLPRFVNKQGMSAEVLLR